MLAAEFSWKQIALHSRAAQQCVCVFVRSGHAISSMDGMSGRPRHRYLGLCTLFVGCFHFKGWGGEGELATC